VAVELLATENRRVELVFYHLHMRQPVNKEILGLEQVLDGRTLVSVGPSALDPAVWVQPFASYKNLFCVGHIRPAVK
jgi:hypothetical protein